MDSIVKRIAAFSLAFWFAIWSVLLPVTANAAIYEAASNIVGSRWYVPGVGTALAGNRVLATAATALGRANPWVAAITIGYPIAKHLLETRGGGQVAVGSGPDTFPAPDGWSSSNQPPSSAPQSGGEYVNSVTDTAPLQTRYRWGVQASGQTHVRDTQEASCRAYVESRGSQWYIYDAVVDNGNGSGVCKHHSTGGSYFDSPMFTSGTYSSCPVGYVVSGSSCVRNTCPDGSTLLNGSCYTSPTCPSGYTMNGDSCILAENGNNFAKWPVGTNEGARAYIPDPVGSNWIPHPRESNPLPQNLTDQQIVDGLLNSQRTYTKDEYGNPVSTQILPNLNGGYTFNQQVQTTNNNQTTTTTNSYTTNAQGAVTNVSSVTNNGPITNVSNNYAVEVPTDYNRESTQQKIYTGEGAQDAPNYDQNIQQKTTDLNKSITDLLDPIKDQFATDKTKWFSWVWTPPVGQCEPITGSVHGKNVSWDLCPYVNKVRDVIGWLFAIVGAWVIYNEMFRRENA